VIIIKDVTYSRLALNNAGYLLIIVKEMVSDPHIKCPPTYFLILKYVFAQHLNRWVFFCLSTWLKTVMLSMNNRSFMADKRFIYAYERIFFLYERYIFIDYRHICTIFIVNKGKQTKI